MALGGKVEARGGASEGSGMGWGIVLAEVSMPPRVVALAAAGSGDVAGMWWSSTVIG